MNQQIKLTGHGKSVPPLITHVLVYFGQKDMTVKEAEAFYYYQQAHKWKTASGTPIKNWKTVASNWIWDIQRARIINIRLMANRRWL